jgi:hypothetical protein
MTTPTIPAALRRFLDKHLSAGRLPEADSVYEIAQMFETTEAVVWEVVRTKVPTAPARPSPPTWIRPLDELLATPPLVEAEPEPPPPRYAAAESTPPLDTQHPFDRLLSALRSRRATRGRARTRSMHGGVPRSSICRASPVSSRPREFRC